MSQLEDTQQLPTETVIALTYVPGIAQRRRDLSLRLTARIADALSVALPRLLTD